jgi:hypothetical protein
MGRIIGLLAILLLSFFHQIAKAQQPAYFILGEDQFRGVQIYDVIQDQESNYWIATDEGLYIYDYHSIRKVECEDSKSNAVFGFVMNKEGTVYCHNLNNQVFQIKKKQFLLFHEINSDESSSDMSLCIADDENLLIGTNRIIVLNKQGKIIQRSKKIVSYIGQPFSTAENKTYYPIQGSDSILVYEHQILSKLKLRISGTVIPQSLRFFRLYNKDYAIDLISSQTYLFDTKKILIKATEKLPFSVNRSTRFYSTGSVVWAADLLPGTHLIESVEQKIKVSNLYNDYYISNAFRDNEGNYLLSTFDKGILVIRDLQVPEVIQSFREDPITALYSDKDLGLLMGSSRGKVFKYQNTGESLINIEGKRSIEKIYGNDASPLIIFDDCKTKAYNKKTHQITEIFERPLKDVAFVSPDEFYIGTNTCIYKCQLHSDYRITHEVVSNINSRIYSMAYNEEEKKLYAATSSGLLSLDRKGAIEYISYKNKGIYPTSRLYYLNGKVYAGERKYGILVVAQNKIVKVISPEVNGQKEVITKIVIKDNNLFAKASSGFYQFDMNGKMTKSIQDIFGFSNKRVIDFTFHKDMLWVSHSGGLQQIDLKYYHANLFTPNFNIRKIYVNDTPKPMSDFVQLSSKERKISFELSSPTLRNRESIRYHYRLLGYDDKWQSNNYDANIITYNALSHGDYIFQVKAENQGKFSAMVSYSFSIAQPFYSQWWFIAGIMILFVLIVLFIYRWQIKQQHKKNEQINELNTSKLTAIKSQMNPHFIFNSLNSIQDLILKGDVENSYSYITTFSNLVRSTLNHSEQEFIDFEQEVKLLELYLSLEKLRFKKNLNYTIEIKNVEDIMLPPLIIQPFIENALVHGLLHKEGAKELKISFEAKEHLICIIEDNGIGRERAKSIKKRQRSEHESFSGKAIRKRFEILSKIFEGDFGFEYEDLYLNGEGSGTKVILTIPIKHKF